MNDPVSLHISQSHPDVLYGKPQGELLREEILADLLEASAARNPDQLALIFGERKLTYRALNAQADLVAARLIDAGVRPGRSSACGCRAASSCWCCRPASPRPAPPGCRSTRTRRSSACKCAWTTRKAPAW
jgi:hypothetical protein